MYKWFMLLVWLPLVRRVGYAVSSIRAYLRGLFSPWRR